VTAAPEAPAGRAATSTPPALAIRATPRSIAYFNQTVGDRVLFAVDQSTLSPEARSILQAQANWLAQNPGYAIIIEGHADEQGTREYNLALGARRAAAVQQFLVSRASAPTG
jgi:peptidoglycan-associated lipoprotein